MYIILFHDHLLNVCHENNAGSCGYLLQGQSTAFANLHSVDPASNVQWLMSGKKLKESLGAAQF